MNRLIKFFILAAVLCQIQATELETVSDDDLVHIIKRHSFAVVLFSEFTRVLKDVFLFLRLLVLPYHYSEKKL